MTLTWMPRLLGLATAGYAAAVLTRPQILLRPTGIAKVDPPATAAATVGALSALTGRGR